MTTFTQPISIPFKPTASYTGEYDKKIDFIEVDDIKDIPLNTPNVGKISLLSTLGVAPSSIETNNLAAIAAISLFFATISSIWVSNIVLLLIFAILALSTFVISIFTEDKPFREKIGGLLGDFFTVGVIGTISQYLFHNYTVPILNVPLPIFSGILWLMIINYIIVDGKRIYPVSSFAKSKFLTAFLLSAQDGFEVFKSKFQDRMEDDISGRERRPN